MISINHIDLNGYVFIEDENEDRVIRSRVLIAVWNKLSIDERSKFFLAEEIKIIPSDYRSGEDIVEDVMESISNDLGVEYGYIKNYCDKKKLQQLEKALNDVLNDGIPMFEKGEQIDPKINYSVK